MVRNCPPSDITVTPSNQFQGYAIVSWTEPSAVDSTVFTSRSRDPGALYQLGTFFQVTYTFSDASGNVATCNFDVNVNPGKFGDRVKGHGNCLALPHDPLAPSPSYFRFYQKSYISPFYQFCSTCLSLPVFTL